MEKYVNRVLLVIPQYKPNVGGLETAVESLSLMLKRNNVDVQIVTSRYKKNLLEEENIGNVMVKRILPNLFWSTEKHWLRNYYVAFKLLFCIKMLFKINKLIYEYKPQVINIFYPMPSAIYFTILSYFHNFAIIVSLHGEVTLSMPFLCAIEKLLFKLIMKKIDYVTACSQSILKEAVKIVPHIKNKSTHIYNGIFSNDYSLKKELREHSHNGRYILTIANLGWYKGIDILLMAMRTVFENGYDVDLIIVGDGSQRRKLIEISKLLKIENKIIFKWFITDEVEKKRLLYNCEFFVLPSRTEPFGIVNLEAMAAGKAIVSTRAGGIPEVIKDGINGLLAEPYNDKMLTEKIITLLKDRDLRDRLGKNGRRIVEGKKFSWYNIAEQYITVYNKVLQKKKILLN